MTFSNKERSADFLCVVVPFITIQSLDKRAVLMKTSEQGDAAKETSEREQVQLEASSASPQRCKKKLILPQHKPSLHRKKAGHDSWSHG